MDNNMNDLINNVKNMVNSGNIPPEIQQMMNSMKSSDNNTSSNNFSNIFWFVDSLLNLFQI